MLRADPTTAKTLLARSLASREMTGCYRNVLHDTAKLRMTPVLEAASSSHSSKSRDAALVMIAQYTLRSIGALEEKLKQYPRGTRFKLNVGSLDQDTASAVVSDVTRFAARLGIEVER